MPKPYPREFRDDVVAVARRREASLKQVAKDFGISESCVTNWLKAAEAEEGGKQAAPGQQESAELAELRKRNRLLEQENEVLHRAAAYLSRDINPGSMGRVGVYGDNAAMESFFALLQKNVLNRQHWNTRKDLRLVIVTWIERTYHRRRRQRRLGRLTPVEFETLKTTAHAA